MNRTFFGIRNLISCVLLAVLTLTVLSGCEENKESDPDAFKLYYLNSAKTGVVAVDYEQGFGEGDIEDRIDELIDMLGTMPEKRQYEAPFTGNVQLMDHFLSDKVLTFNFAGSYSEIEKSEEVLDRAAIVMTFTQLEEVDYVSFQVDDVPLTDHYGNMIGNMSADTFIFNMGNEISTYEKVELKLYFANETGDGLVPVFRSVVYNSNISMERLALEQVIKGPNTDICFPTISKDTKINSLNVRDGVCYVDFDSSFLTQPYNVASDVALYSIVNTIAELPDVNKVEFTVGGEEPFIFMDSTISGAYERNLDLID